jgi:hypothetical protein
MIRALALPAFASVVALLAAGCDAESAQVTSRIVAEVDEKKADVRPANFFPLSHPLQWDATVTQNGRDGIPRTRYYVKGGK